VTIDRYAFATLTPRRDRRVLLRAADFGVEEAHDGSEVPKSSRLSLHHAVYSRIAKQFFGSASPGLELVTSVESPAGSGLGSSSALVVAMVEVFREAYNLPLGLYDVAHLAYEIERLDLALAGGKQDQYAAAFGGINFIEFLPGDRVIVNPLRVRRAIISELESSIVICYSGQSRSSDAIIRDQIRASKEVGSAALQGLNSLKRDAIDMKEALLRGDIHLMAEILDRSWASKKETATSITNHRIEELYSVGCNSGALAGKVSGAGGGGFLMFITEPERKARLIAALSEAGSVADKVIFTHSGVEAWSIPSAVQAMPPSEAARAPL
jgi:D-glycero-alpha-D-manno-heptose-7-phosphate kinase